MKRNVQRRADILSRVRIVKRDRPRHVGRATEAAPREEAAHPADHVTERNAGREDVGDGPHRHAMPSQIPQRDDDRCDQPAVKHAARPQQRQQFLRIPAERVEFDDQEQQLRAGERADDDPDAEVHHPVRIESALAGADQCELQPQQVGGGQQDAVGVDREASDFKQDWMHVAARFRSCRAGPEWPRS